MAAEFRNAVTVNADIQQVCALLSDPAFGGTLKLVYKSQAPSYNGVIFSFSSETSFTSWGEHVTITVMPTAGYGTQIDVYSKCSLPTQIVDWGKNKENVTRILSYVQQNLARYAPAQYAAPAPAPAPFGGNRFCPHCGAQVPVDALFCSRCGNRQN